MQIHKKWTEEEIIQLKKDYENYLPKDELVAKYSRSLSAILSKAYDLGLTRSYPRHHRGYGLPLTLNELKCLYLSGKSIKELAVLCRSSESNISTHLKNLGVQLRKKTHIKNIDNLPEVSIISDYESGLDIKSISDKYGSSVNALKRLLKKFGIRKKYFIGRIQHKNRKYTYDEHFFDDVNSEEKAYFLGLLYADGCISERGVVRLRLQEKDKEIVQRFSNAIKSTRNLLFEPARTENRSDLFGVILHGKYIVSKLRELGCVSNKTFKLTFPEWLDSKLYNHFIRGYFDGDGCITISNNKPAFSLVGTEAFIRKVMSIIVDNTGLNEVKLSTRYPERNNNIRSMSYSGRFVVLRIREWLYKDATIYMQRKYDKFFSIPINLEIHRGGSTYTKSFDSVKSQI